MVHVTLKVLLFQLVEVEVKKKRLEAVVYDRDIKVISGCFRGMWSRRWEVVDAEMRENLERSIHPIFGSNEVLLKAGHDVMEIRRIGVAFLWP